MKKSVLILNGPALTDPKAADDEYSRNVTIEEIGGFCAELCDALDLGLDFRQTDDLDEMYRWITSDSQAFSGLLVNPGCYSHATTEHSNLIRSAIQAIDGLEIPVIEVHIENIDRDRAGSAGQHDESTGADGFVSGFGKFSYSIAIKAVANRASQTIAA